MRRTLICLSFLVAVLLLCGTAQAKSDLNVVGLTPGMTIDEVASKLGSGYQKAKTVLIEKGDVFNFTKDAEAFNVLAMGGKVVFIQHVQIFPPEALISAEELTKFLATKYGPPSIHSDDDQAEAWLVVDGKVVAADAMTDQLRACVTYETQGPFFVAHDKENFSFLFPRVPVLPQLAGCGTVIQAKPTLSRENPGLVTQLDVSMFDVKMAQAWFDAAMADYNKYLKTAVDAARKNKPNL